MLNDKSKNISAKVALMKFMKTIFYFLIITFLLFQFSCAPASLISDENEPEKYKIEKILPEDKSNINPSFIVYGDSRPGWRLLEKFIMKKNWPQVSRQNML